PKANTTLSGLYMSDGMFCTQCEAEGFRRITYSYDRPDNMSVYHVAIIADRARFPVLLSNGNASGYSTLPGGRHKAVWDDPFPKPSYLFALVAGDLAHKEDTFVTASGRRVKLGIYVTHGNEDKVDFAMGALKRSMKWDEEKFGREYDLDIFNIVAVSDFNMGAMENKGLNVFNDSLVLATPETATDMTFMSIERVIAHEYFHNWTGNRITCRDWFQLSLKEGLTVFRDQEFSMDMAGSASARAVKRILDVRMLRERQFPEDAGTMAHPVRPDAYVAIDNFYTATVYEKGAEVVRMMQTLVGREGFARGMTLYFERFDGQAVTCDDFAQAIADANPQSPLARLLPQFKNWYSQAGTPRLTARGRYDAPTRTYTLGIEQSNPAAAANEPYVIPLALGLVGRDGRALPLQLEDEPATSTTERVLVLQDSRSFFTFVNVDVEPVPSLLRGFSAPVILVDGLSDADLLTLLQHDADPFNRWEAGQRLALNRLLAAVRGDGTLQLDARFVEAMRAVLRHPTLDPAFKDLVLRMPSEGYVAEQAAPVDPHRIHAAREAMQSQLARALRADWEWAWQSHQVSGAYSPDAISAGKRALANRALAMICRDAVALRDPVWQGRTYQRFKSATNMTDR
ncbi:MAG TPA: aminopeptidase N, partial [Burkholderiaceae bacterium]|nr:aminopeptidase N [Burkholderiaceae bacterium]